MLKLRYMRVARSAAFASEEKARLTARSVRTASRKRLRASRPGLRHRARVALVS
jgi:hypothetical protein